MVAAPISSASMSGIGGFTPAALFGAMVHTANNVTMGPSSVRHPSSIIVVATLPTSLRLYCTYLHNLLADIIDLLGYTVLILIKTGVTEIEI